MRRSDGCSPGANALTTTQRSRKVLPYTLTIGMSLLVAGPARFTGFVTGLGVCGPPRRRGRTR